MNGAHVRVEAIYTADLMHGATLTDSRCPKESVDEGVAPISEDISVKRFHDIVPRVLSGAGRADFIVDISGKYMWSKDDEFPHGVISIEHVWSVKIIDRPEKASK